MRTREKTSMRITRIKRHRISVLVYGNAKKTSDAGANFLGGGRPSKKKGGGERNWGLKQTCSNFVVDKSSFEIRIRGLPRQNEGGGRNGPDWLGGVQKNGEERGSNIGQKEEGLEGNVGKNRAATPERS